VVIAYIQMSRSGTSGQLQLRTVSILRSLVDDIWTAERSEAGRWIRLPHHSFLGVESSQFNSLL
jgi:hypothetical protein